LEKIKNLEDQKSEYDLSDEDLEKKCVKYQGELDVLSKLNTACEKCNGTKIKKRWFGLSKKTCETCNGSGENSANKKLKRELERSLRTILGEVHESQQRRTDLRNELNELKQKRTDTLDKICKLEDKLNEADANKSQDNAYRRSLQRKRV